MRAAVPRIKRDRPLVIPQGRIVALQIAMGEAEIILQIGVLRVADGGAREESDCVIPDFLIHRLLCRGVIGIAGGEVRIAFVRLRQCRCGESRHRRDRHRRDDAPAPRPPGMGEPSKSKTLHRDAINAFTCVSSGRTVSAFFVSTSNWLEYVAAFALSPAAAAAIAAP